MTEIVQQVRTVFTAESGALQRELAAIKAASQQATREVEQFQKRASPHHAPSAGLRAEAFGIEREIEALLASNAPSAGLLAEAAETERELEALLGAANRTTPAIAAVGEAAESTGKRARGAGKGVGDLRESVKGAIGPLDGLRGGFNLLKENFAFIGLGAYAVVEAISAISDAFSDSDEIAAEYTKAVKGLAEELARVAKFSKENRIFLGWEKAPTEGRTRLEQIVGTQGDAASAGIKGEWQLAHDRAEVIRGAIEFDQRRAREAGLKLTDSGLVDERYLGAVRLDGGRSGKVYNQLSDPKQEGGSLAMKIAELAQVEAAIGKLVAERVGIEAKVKEDATKVAEEHRKAAESAAKVAQSLSEAASELALRTRRTPYADESKEDFTFRFYKVPPVVKTTIDARGSKITLNTKLETDDPGRFADASLKAAFLGVSARPLSAVFGLGSPGLANGGR